MTTTHILGDNVPRKSNFDPDLARKVTKYYEEHPEALIEKTEVTSASVDITKQSIEEYILMPEIKTYALGVHALQEQCVKENNQNQPQFVFHDGRVRHRPNTFKENCLARLHQFNTLTNSDGSQRTLRQRMEFLIYGNESCCGIAYPAAERKSSKFKSILKSPELIIIPQNFKFFYYPVDYAQLPCTRELDRSGAKYNEHLTPAEIDSHEGWLTLFEEDAIALHDYRKMFGEALALNNPQNLPQKYMAFWILNAPQEDQLRALYVSCLGDISCAYGNSVLNCIGSFLRRKP